ncbi:MULTISPECIES: N-acetylglucosamine MFS transporter NagP [unclassified Pseudoalteromonas]|jgi:glucose/galactose transporter|uniref:N-acetylglucosamine MFS transporter NagP n=1 Tax=unclassified Pseudoalteromonas TaxID=194690 RepID=UPI0007305E12|nr:MULTISPECIES: sugar MFS transporter [unclassified Pseudoalteromonas]KTD97590.1 MFS transporter [Pseudoalteromonas sp. H71]TMN83495.1 glucose/galactose MFS transporter [Pseudoalteromonas sp. S410]TMN90985.1 glucose/galactose MFS transporter [Pseudoalteromonas sp. S408]TMN94599.1 glucose/galactose MFS transporter [Pseudoalteromonas sp. S407]TMN99016.1 glucose/galactose MFS transporter [Pseudoalteromonas sp. S409]
MTTNVMDTPKSSSMLPMAIVAVLFFILGFATWLNGSLMPYLSQILKLTPFQGSLILFSFYIAVTFTALPSAVLIKKVGYKNGMAMGMGLMMIAGLLFIPAAMSQVFPLFLLAQLVMGAGQTLLQTAVNPYVVRLGPEESAAVRISIMGILNKGAGVISPLVFTALILSNFTDTVGTELSQQQVDDMANGLILPYLGMALFIGLLAFAVKKSPLPELITDDAEQTSSNSEIRETLSHPNLVFGAIAIFLYVAVEVIAGDTIGTFALSLGVANYSVMTSYTMIFMVFGYILGILLIPKFITQQTALTLSAVLGIAITLCILLIDAQSFIIANALLIPLGGANLPDVLLLIAFLGLANAIVWPAVFPLALSGLGKLTSTGSALLVMGIAGGAFGPVLWGLLSGFTSLQTGYSVLLPCYLFILFYAVKGHKMKKQ